MVYNTTNNLYGFFSETPSCPPLEDSLWPQPGPVWGLAPPVPLSHHDNDGYAGEMFCSNHNVLDRYPPIFQSQTWDEYRQYHSSPSHPNPYRPPPPTPPSTPTSGLNQPPVSMPSSNPTSVADDVGSVKAGLIKVETVMDAPAVVPEYNKKANPGQDSADTNAFCHKGEAEFSNTYGSNQPGLGEHPSSDFTNVERDSINRRPHSGRIDIKRGSPQKTTKRGRQGRRYDLEKDPRLLMCTPLKTEEVKIEADEEEVQASKTLSSKRKMGADASEPSPPPPLKRQRDKTTLEGHINGPSNDNPSSSSQLKLDTFAMDSVHDQADLQGSERTFL